MNKVIATLSLARRAGKLAIGFDATKNALRQRIASVIVMTSDISEGTKKKILQFSEDISIVELPFLGDDMALVFNKKFVVASITDENFKELLIKALKEAV